MEKKKIIALTLAVSVSATALLAGTYAWRSMNQKVKNEALVQANPGGRLHDDFNGLRWNASDTNIKKVYVENFTEEDGGANIYARIRLDEYLELGIGAGKANGESGKAATPIIDTYQGVAVDISKPETWIPYKWDEASEFRSYVTINTGGQAIYLPTYNKNQDSVDADINGTLEGPDGKIETRIDAYEDYEKYVQDKAVGGVEIYTVDEDDYDELDAAEITTEQLIDAVWDAKENALKDSSIAQAGKTFQVGSVSCKVTEATYDSYNDLRELYVDVDAGQTQPDGSDPDGADIMLAFLDEDDYHKGTTTLETEKFISVAEWNQLPDNQKVGNYWVYDTEEGWVYWASPIKPSTATGCLIQNIECANQGLLSGEYYYGLNVVAQFASVEDVCDADGDIGFCKESVPEAVKTLLETITAAEND